MLDKSKYPKNWNQISRQIRDRDGNKCVRCGVSNHAIGYRDAVGVFHYVNDPESALGYPIVVEEGFDCFKTYKVIRIVLTCAHLGVPKDDGSPGDKRDKMDCRPINLMSLCQACHFKEDRDEHAETRRRKKEAKNLPQKPIDNL